MRDPARLLDQGANAWERALLGAGASEEPPETGRHRLATLLGVSAGLTTIVGGSHAAASTAVKASTPWIAKWAAWGGGAVVLAVAGASAVIERPEEPRRAAQGVSAAAQSRETQVERDVEPAKTRVAAPTTAPSQAGSSHPVVEPRRQPRPAQAVAASPRERASAEGEPPASITREIQSLDRIRHYLRSGSPVAALSGLDAHRARYPRGMFGPEMRLLRIEALAAAGRHAEARRAAVRLLQAHPSSPHAQRIRTLVGLNPQ